MALSALKTRIAALEKERDDLEKSLETLVNDYIRTLQQQASPIDALSASLKYLNFFAGGGVTVEDTHNDEKIEMDLVPPGSQENIGFDLIQEVLSTTIGSFRKVLESTKYTLRWDETNDGQFFFVLRLREPHEKEDDIF
jgi:hypothetical protein